MYESAHFISSKTLSAFRDFPMPEAYADYPKHDKILNYIQAYAQKHELSSLIRFETEISRLDLVPETESWRVHFQGGEIQEYAGVICATGLTWHPNVPEIPGTFSGELYHSQQYFDYAQFKDKRVLIVGAGNSGCDIACDAAQVAKEAYISMRRGYYFFPKYIFGLPTDVYAHKGPKLPDWLDRRLSKFIINHILVGNLERYGLPKPDHPFLSSHPIMNTQLLHHLGHGDIQAKKDIKSFQGKTVEFVEGSSVEVDVVVLATGYKRIYPFLSDTLLTYKKGVLDLYLEIFDRKHNNLFFLGGIETDGAAFHMLGKQAELVARFLQSKEKNPQKYQAFIQKKSAEYPNLHGRVKYLDTQRHNYYVNYDKYHSLLDNILKHM